MTVLVVDDERLPIQTLAKNIDWAHLGVSATCWPLMPSKRKSC